MTNHQSQPLTAPGVVAGLVPHGRPDEVARAAVAEAERRHCRVTFVQVLPTGLSTEDRADADALTFRAAVAALHGRSRVSFAFEAAQGDAARVLLARSRTAQALVVGEDVTGATVARDCRERASCDVLTVGSRTVAPAQGAGIPE